MIDPDISFRSTAEETAYWTVSAELAARIQRRDYVPEGEREGWRQNMFPFGDRWSRVREMEACMAFREPTDAASAVIADALIRAGRVTGDLYLRLLAVADRRHAEHLRYPGPPVTRAVAFDAFGTLVRIGRRHRPYERLAACNRPRAALFDSPMIDPIGLTEYANLIGLPYPDEEVAMLADELASIELYLDARDCLARVRDRGMTVAIASNLALPYEAPLRALLGDLVDVWHFSFAVGAAKPQRAFYAALTDRLGIEAGELLMVGDTWKDDVVGAVDAGARARWLDREGRSGYVRRFVTVRTLDDIGWDLRSAADPTALTA